MGAVRVVLTYADYVALPNDGKRYEIHDGELSVTPAPGRTHQRLVLELGSLLNAHVKARSLGEIDIAPFDVILDDTSIVQPDVVYIARDRSGVVSERGVDGAPTLAIEIMSPSTVQIDRGTKLQLYARHRVPHYWIVDPVARTVEAYRLRSGAYELSVRAEPFPDLEILLASLWP
ncbi:MAG: Uma2 family endonuclease [Dehalococcoidia bacterium]|nr:Uma2 family endonuclease [Dehalococcoidia bacterium]